MTEDDESPLSACHRELREELCIALPVGRLLLGRPWPARGTGAPGVTGGRGFVWRVWARYSCSPFVIKSRRKPSQAVLVEPTTSRVKKPHSQWAGGPVVPRTTSFGSKTISA